MPKIQTNGVELYYELHGAEDAPLLVLNNGILMNAAGSWVFQTQALSKHYRVLQYDCRGQGQSEHPDEAYSMEMHADDLAALLIALGYEQAHIAGISYGGEVGQAFVLKYPQRCLSLILADTVSEVGDELRIIIEFVVERRLCRGCGCVFQHHRSVEFLNGVHRRQPEIAGGRQRTL